MAARTWRRAFASQRAAGSVAVAGRGATATRSGSGQRSEWTRMACHLRVHSDLCPDPLLVAVAPLPATATEPAARWEAKARRHVLAAIAAALKVPLAETAQLLDWAQVSVGVATPVSVHTLQTWLGTSTTGISDVYFRPHEHASLVVKTQLPLSWSAYDYTSEGYENSTAVCDLIDNSIDAIAPLLSKTSPTSHYIRVSIDCAKRLLQIEDTGKGMTYDEIKRACNLGTGTSKEMKQLNPNHIGHFGSGLKGAAFHLSVQPGTLSILTASQSFEQYEATLVSNLDRDASVEFPITPLGRIATKSFTKITLGPLRQLFIDQCRPSVLPAWEEVLSAIYTFRVPAKVLPALHPLTPCFLLKKSAAPLSSVREAARKNFSMRLSEDSNAERIPLEQLPHIMNKSECNRLVISLRGQWSLHRVILNFKGLPQKEHWRVDVLGVASRSFTGGGPQLEDIISVPWSKIELRRAGLEPSLVFRSDSGAPVATFLILTCAAATSLEDLVSVAGEGTFDAPLPDSLQRPPVALEFQHRSILNVTSDIVSQILKNGLPDPMTGLPFPVRLDVKVEGLAARCQGLIWYFPHVRGKSTLPMENRELWDPPTPPKPVSKFLLFQAGKLLYRARDMTIGLDQHKNNKRKRGDALPIVAYDRWTGLLFLEGDFRLDRLKASLKRSSITQAFKDAKLDAEVVADFTRFLTDCHQHYDHEISFESSGEMFAEDVEAVLGHKLDSRRHYYRRMKIGTRTFSNDKLLVYDGKPFLIRAFSHEQTADEPDACVVHLQHLYLPDAATKNIPIEKVMDLSQTSLTVANSAERAQFLDLAQPVNLDVFSFLSEGSGRAPLDDLLRTSNLSRETLPGKVFLYAVNKKKEPVRLTEDDEIRIKVAHGQQSLTARLSHSRSRFEWDTTVVERGRSARISAWSLSGNLTLSFELVRTSTIIAVKSWTFSISIGEFDTNATSASFKCVRAQALQAGETFDAQLSPLDGSGHAVPISALSCRLADDPTSKRFTCTATSKPPSPTQKGWILSICLTPTHHRSLGVQNIVCLVIEVTPLRGSPVFFTKELLLLPGLPASLGDPDPPLPSTLGVGAGLPAFTMSLLDKWGNRAHVTGKVTASANNRSVHSDSSDIFFPSNILKAPKHVGKFDLEISVAKYGGCVWKWQFAVERLSFQAQVNLSECPVSSLLSLSCIFPPNSELPRVLKVAIEDERADQVDSTSVEVEIRQHNSTVSLRAPLRPGKYRVTFRDEKTQEHVSIPLTVYSESVSLFVVPEGALLGDAECLAVSCDDPVSLRLELSDSFSRVPLSTKHLLCRDAKFISPSKNLNVKVKSIDEERGVVVLNFSGVAAPYTLRIALPPLRDAFLPIDLRPGNQSPRLEVSYTDENGVEKDYDPTQGQIVVNITVHQTLSLRCVDEYGNQIADETTLVLHRDSDVGFPSRFSLIHLHAGAATIDLSRMCGEERLLLNRTYTLIYVDENFPEAEALAVVVLQLILPNSPKSFTSTWGTGPHVLTRDDAGVVAIPVQTLVIESYDEEIITKLQAAMKIIDHSGSVRAEFPGTRVSHTCNRILLKEQHCELAPAEYELRYYINNLEFSHKLVVLPGPPVVAQKRSSQPLAFDLRDMHGSQCTNIDGPVELHSSLGVFQGHAIRGLAMFDQDLEEDFEEENMWLAAGDLEIPVSPLQASLQRLRGQIDKLEQEVRQLTQESELRRADPQMAEWKAWIDTQHTQIQARMAIPCPEHARVPADQHRLGAVSDCGRVTRAPVACALEAYLGDLLQLPVSAKGWEAAKLGQFKGICLDSPEAAISKRSFLLCDESNTKQCLVKTAETERLRNTSDNSKEIMKARSLRHSRVGFLGRGVNMVHIVDQDKPGDPRAPLSLRRTLWGMLLGNLHVFEFRLWKAFRSIAIRCTANRRRSSRCFHSPR
eukprot:TRINITY_DN6415_c0_g1_i1.p1 TRINITY_DN6415_c0_g1~~TRINITY_DN6415_c0_g1_i1.p1  ORF type:complete len:1916 (-),score=290.54 TRINITY_DN6415_c0_g1_i1:300-6047(-)